MELVGVPLVVYLATKMTSLLSHLRAWKRTGVELHWSRERFDTNSMQNDLERLLPVVSLRAADGVGDIDAGLWHFVVDLLKVICSPRPRYFCAAGMLRLLRAISCPSSFKIKATSPF